MAIDQSPIMATLTKFGITGVQSLKHDVDRVSATGNTSDSIRFEISRSGDGTITLSFYARKHFKTLETGRGPRKSSTYGEFDLNMLEYMKARGIGADLDEKEREQLARFLTLKINREGDSVFKKGGRVVYSPTITKLVTELKQAIAKDFKSAFIKSITAQFKIT